MIAPIAIAALAGAGVLAYIQLNPPTGAECGLADGVPCAGTVQGVGTSVQGDAFVGDSTALFVNGVLSGIVQGLGAIGTAIGNAIGGAAGGIVGGLVGQPWVWAVGLGLVAWKLA